MVEKKDNQADVYGEDYSLLDAEVIDLLGAKQSPEERIVDNEVNNVLGDEPEEEDEESDGGAETQENDDTEDTEKGEGTESDENADKSSSPLIPYAKYLKEEGILPDFDLEKFDGSIEGLREGMFQEIVNGVESYKETLPPVVKALINNYEEGVPLETLIKTNSERIRYSTITPEQLENEDVQKSLIREYYSKTTKFSQEKIEKELNKLADLQELEEEAKDVLPQLLALQDEEEKTALAQVQAQKEAQEKKRLEELESVKVAVETLDEIIPGNKISTVMKQKIFQNLTTAVARTDDGVPVNRLGAYRIQNPVQTEIILNYIFEATKEFKDWSVFNKGAKKAVVAEIEQAARNVENQLGARRNTSSSKAAQSLLKEIENFEF